MVNLHIGFDDTDSPNGGCTTYIAALLVEKFNKMHVNFTDYPCLIRLNPNVPWKTRGNGALCLRIQCPESNIEKIKCIVKKTIRNNSDLSYEGTDPGIVIMKGKIPQSIKDFAKKAEQSILTIDESKELAKRVGAEIISFKRGRGIIGGLAAIGEDLKEDHTFEIITYRKSENRNKPRHIEASSVKEMDSSSKLTFNNIDHESGRILITPRGPDPIFFGIRGETPEAVKQAFTKIKTNESIERWMIFRSNQGTDAHLEKETKTKDIELYNPVIINGIVSSVPRIIKGGHVIFSIQDSTGQVDCSAYEPTVILSRIARKLIIGDILTVYGGVRFIKTKNKLSINLEKIRIHKLAPKLQSNNPICSKCTKRLKSMGKNQGFRCKNCGFRSSKIKKSIVEIPRELKNGLYITAPRSQRHLTKPYSRYGKEKVMLPRKMIKEWHQP